MSLYYYDFLGIYLCTKMCDNFVNRSIGFFFLLILLIILNVGSAPARDRAGLKEKPSFSTSVIPEYQMALHNVGKLVFGVSNFGQFANGDIGLPYTDCFTGVKIPDMQYPKGTRSRYLYKGGIWVGGVCGRDTLVSTGCDFNGRSREFHPDFIPFGKIKRHSILDTPSEETFEARSQQDYELVFYDTLVYGNRYSSFDPISARPHEPLQIKVTLKSYAWSYDYADDFVIFECAVKNLSDRSIREVYFGIYMDPDSHEDVRNTSATTGEGKPPSPGAEDDFAGFLRTYPASNPACGFVDTINAAWAVDNDGDPLGIDNFIVPGITGVRFLEPKGPWDVESFNWWVFNYSPTYDFGPQQKDNYRPMGNGLGTPIGDKNKYAMMSNGEIDYDQIMTYDIRPTDPVWIYPKQPYAQVFSRGRDVQYVISRGPYNLGAGQEMIIPFAIVAGENFHQDYKNYTNNLRRMYAPSNYYANVNFAEFAANAVWASWIYDNPGVDTDTNHYFGEFTLCCEGNYCDTFWYQGDGIPDLVGASPPPAPVFWIEPTVGKIKIRWNGLKSETTRDIFSRRIDFEGYRVYLARDNRETSFSLVASYDIEDFRKYVFNLSTYSWILIDTIFTRADLRCLYGDSIDGSPCNDSLFDPNLYTKGYPYIKGDSMFYFESQDFNRHILANYPHANTGISKIYPGQPYPSSFDPALADTSELTPDGYFKYFEYEYTIDNLLPTVSYYVSVTAFDYGSPRSNLGPLETSRNLNAKLFYPLHTPDSAATKNLDVYVYPNPYRIDGGYLEAGYEGRNAEYYIPDRLRRIHFANLPAECTIGIYSLDGDLIREFEHRKDPGDGTASHDEWDLITRNTQRIVTGIYYWVVKAKDGRTQVGKLVIIM